MSETQAPRPEPILFEPLDRRNFVPVHNLLSHILDNPRGNLEKGLSGQKEICGKTYKASVMRPFVKTKAHAVLIADDWAATFYLPNDWPNHQEMRDGSINLFEATLTGDIRSFETDIIVTKMAI